MCQAVDEMIEDGRREATVRILSGLVKDGILSMEEAASRAGMSVEELKIDIENIEFNNEYQKKQFMEQLKNNQELLEKFSNDRLKVILQYYLDENNKKRERLKKISN